MHALHIFNGSALAEAMKAEGLGGTHLAWQEAYCEGPLAYRIYTPESQEERRAYWTSVIGPETYESTSEFGHTLEKLTQIPFLERYEEIVCWFGMDYFCQFNCIALFSMWHQLGANDLSIKMVSVDSHPETGPITCLGNLTPKQLMEVYEDRKSVGANLVKVADILWQLLNQDDPTRFNSFPLNAPFDPLNWRRFILNYSQLFPSLQEGVNILERRVLECLGTESQSQKRLIRTLLLEDRYYGLGDSQYLHLVAGPVSELYHKQGTGWESRYSLNARGAAVLSGNPFQRESLSQETSLMGKPGYSWDKKSLRLVENG